MIVGCARQFSDQYATSGSLHAGFRWESCTQIRTHDEVGQYRLHGQVVL